MAAGFVGNAPCIHDQGSKGRFQKPFSTPLFPRANHRWQKVQRRVSSSHLSHFIFQSCQQQKSCLLLRTGPAAERSV